ncbi:MAG: noncanonical pyrimidine nucleotidase, YjjG family [Ruminococcaceae bacterium]|nr:noncanonical pyrimidine nucleotidase, YjjG family [Oscillospiraceae bacterium]
MIKAVLIDIDNTLLDFIKSSEKAIEQIFFERGLPYDSHVIEVFKEVNDKLWDQIERSEITKPEMYKLRWKTVLEKLNISYDSDELETVFRSTLSGIAEPVDNAYEMLEYLYPKYPLYTASNSSYEHQKKRLIKSDMIKYFTDIFVSEKVGALKPAKEYFDKCLSLMGDYTPNEIALIGDSLAADITGGNNYGLKTIWFNPDKLEIPDYPKPDYTVSSLLEVLNIL